VVEVLKAETLKQRFSGWHLALIAVGMGTFVFIAGIGIDWLLTSSRRAVLYSDALTATVASVLTYCVIRHYHLRQKMAEAHIRALNEVNHHVRNALTAISYCAYLSADANIVAVTENSIERIDNALRELSREILPNRGPWLVPRRPTRQGTSKLRNEFPAAKTGQNHEASQSSVRNGTAD
jgi:hypothetical protein